LGLTIDTKKYPFCYSGHQYALSVLSNSIPSCIYIRGACERYIRDLDNTEDFYLDLEKAERYLRLVQQLEHVIGEWKTKTITYSPWQNFVWMNIIGFISKESGYRRFRIAHVEVARGNAKSAMASQAVLYFLALDNPKGNQISTIATRREQARIVLDSARSMARKSKSYRASTGVKVQAHAILHDKSDSKVKSMSSDHTGLDGLNDVLAVCDELHAMTRETFDVIYSGMSKRKDSLTLCITTAGFSVDSVGYSQSAYAKKVSLGEMKDDQFFSLVYTLDKDDNCFDPNVWIKANPGFGDSVDPTTFAAKAMKAKEDPSDLPNFKVKHCNMWLSEAHAFYDLQKWDACADPSLKIDDFKGERCFAAIDIANKVDLASLGFVFKRKDTIESSPTFGKDIFYLFDKSYLPEETIKTAKNDIYERSVKDGYLIKTPGEAIEYSILAEEMKDRSKIHKYWDIHYDSWNASSFAQDLSKERLPMVEFRFNTANLSEPTKNLDALVRQGRVRHNGSPLLRWCIGNVVCKEDVAGNVFPKKSNEKLKIDAAIVLIMAIAGWMQKDLKESVYSTRGIRTI
jgi:phage terminase large subunit-like protein